MLRSLPLLQALPDDVEEGAFGAPPPAGRAASGAGSGRDARSPFSDAYGGGLPRVNEDEFDDAAPPPPPDDDEEEGFVPMPDEEEEEQGGEEGDARGEGAPKVRVV